MQEINKKLDTQLKNALKCEIEKLENIELLTADETAELLGIKKCGLTYFQKSTGIKSVNIFIKSNFYNKAEIANFLKNRE